MPILHLASTVLALLLAAPAVAGAQSPAPAGGGSTLDRTPNLATGWLGEPGTIHFNFFHRFTESGPPEHQVSNSPTFVVAGGLPWRTTAGFAYATSSAVAPGRPNEWELFGRVMPLARGNAIADLSLQAGYNVGATSTDVELALARSVGPARLFAAGRAFSNAFRAGDGRTAVAGGISLRLTRLVAVAGDVATLLDRRDDERIAWGAGLQLGIPNTPHSLSIHATNVLTMTLQGVSSGVARTRYGFEYTVPIALARYIPALRSEAPAVATGRAESAAGAPVTTTGDTVRVYMRQLAYEPARVEVRPGTTVVWTNDAPLAHTVTADSGGFNSGTIEVSKQWTHTFDRPGSYPYHCEPHPFMKGVVVVR